MNLPAKQTGTKSVTVKHEDVCQPTVEDTCMAVTEGDKTSLQHPCHSYFGGHITADDETSSIKDSVRNMYS